MDSHFLGTIATHVSVHLRLLPHKPFHPMDNHFLGTISIHANAHFLLHGYTFPASMEGGSLATIVVHSNDHWLLRRCILHLTTHGLSFGTIEIYSSDHFLPRLSGNVSHSIHNSPHISTVMPVSYRVMLQNDLIALVRMTGCDRFRSNKSWRVLPSTHSQLSMYSWGMFPSKHVESAD